MSIIKAYPLSRLVDCSLWVRSELLPKEKESVHQWGKMKRRWCGARRQSFRSTFQPSPPVTSFGAWPREWDHKHWSVWNRRLRDKVRSSDLLIRILLGVFFGGLLVGETVAEPEHNGEIVCLSWEHLGIPLRSRRRQKTDGWNVWMQTFSVYIYFVADHLWHKHVFQDKLRSISSHFLSVNWAAVSFWWLEVSDWILYQQILDNKRTQIWISVSVRNLSFSNDQRADCDRVFVEAGSAWAVGRSMYQIRCEPQ